MEETTHQHPVEVPQVTSQEQPQTPSANADGQVADTFFQRLSADWGEPITEENYKQRIEAYKNPKAPEPVFNSPAEQWLAQKLSETTDVEQRRKVVQEFAAFNGRDWEKASHEDILMQGLRMKFPNATESQIRAKYVNDYGSPKLRVEDYKDEDGNILPDAQMKAELAQLEFSEAVRSAQDAIKSKIVDMRPAERKDNSPDMGALERQYNAVAKSSLSSFKAGHGDVSWSPGAAEIESVSSPQAFSSLISELFPDGQNINLGLLAEINMLREFRKSGLKVLVEKAAGKQVAKLQDALENPSTIPPTQTPGQENTAGALFARLSAKYG